MTEVPKAAAAAVVGSASDSSKNLRIAESLRRKTSFLHDEAASSIVTAAPADCELLYFLFSYYI